MQRKLLGAAALVLLLFANGSANAQSNAPLADAAEKKDRAKVATLLKQGADVNSPQADGMTAIHWAVYHDDLRTATLLIDAGANVKAANYYSVTPLSLACTNGNTEIVELLLKAGADPKATLRGGETPLMTAARTGKPGPVKALLARGADVNAKDRKGQTALMWAAADGHAGVVSILLAAGADFRTPLPSGFTPLLFAAREGRIDVVRILLKAGADVNEAIQSQKTVSRGPSSGTSALLLAVENGHFELAIALVKAGADPNDQRSGCAALHMISWVRKPNRGDSEDGDPPPIGSGKLTSLEFLKAMVAHGAKANLQQKKGVPGRGILSRVGATPLIAAASTSDVALMRTLIELGADPLLPNAQGSTPLLAAAGVGIGAPEEAAGSEPEALEAIELLLKLGADVNAVDKNGETAMHGAAYRNHPKVVQLLADKGAKIAVWNRANKTGLTPLVIAEGHRPGLNFRPSPETVAAFHRVMLAAGVTPPKKSAPPANLKSDYADGEPQSRLPRDNLLLYRGRDGKPVAVTSVEDWAKRRAEVVRGMESVMGMLPGAAKRCALEMKVEDEVDGETFVRRLVTYASEPGGRVPAYLLVPKDVLAGKKKAPAVLCLHGTDNIIGHGTVVGLGKPNRGYALELAQRGYVTLAPNYPLLAKYQPDLKKLGWESGTLKAVWDNMRGLDLLASLPFVDSSRGFGTIGHSLGGHNSVYTAVFDDRLKVIVSSCGLDSYLDYFDGNPKNWDPEKGWCQTRYMRKLADYKDRLADIPFDFHEMVGALAPRHTLIIAPTKDSNFRADSVDRIIAAARPVYKLLGHEQRLRLEHPDCGHDFPPEMREAAYKLFDAVLAGK